MLTIYGQPPFLMQIDVVLDFISCTAIGPLELIPYCLFGKKTRLIGLALAIHVIADVSDCLLMSF